MVANIFTVGCLVLAVVSGVLSVNTNNVVEIPEPLATGLATQASIWLTKKEGTKSKDMFLCSASIIAHDHVLAHTKCIEYYNADKLVIALGTADLINTSTTYKVINIVYEAKTEMALLRTGKNTFETTSVVTLRDKPLSANSKCDISGWFDSTTPWKKQPVTYIPADNCAEQYETTHNMTVEDGSICASGVPEKNCGSLGMPLTCDDQLTGLFSVTDWECKLPAQCTGVPHSKAWIQKQLELARGGASGISPSLFAAFAALLVAYKTLF